MPRPARRSRLFLAAPVVRIEIVIPVGPLAAQALDDRAIVPAWSWCRASRRRCAPYAWKAASERAPNQIGIGRTGRVALSSR